MTKVSVIVPVYNVEDYLGECLDSLITQTLSDIEIICINDGSTDNSLEILTNYSKRDSRIKIITQENKGLSSARNRGFEFINGKYTYFIDSDDILKSDALEKLYNLACDKKTDFIIFKLINFDSETKEFSKNDYFEAKKLAKRVENKVFNYKDIIDIVFSTPVSTPGNFYKSEFVKNFRFIENKIFEDNLFFAECIFNAKRVYFLNQHLYYRRIRPDSITTTPTKNYVDRIYISNRIFDLTKKLNLFEDCKKQLYNKKINLAYNYLFELEGEDREYFFSEVKKDFQNKKEEFEGDHDFLKVLYPKSKKIFYAGLSSTSANEFKLAVESETSDHSVTLEKENDGFKKKIKKDFKSLIPFKNINFKFLKFK